MPLLSEQQRRSSARSSRGILPLLTCAFALCSAIPPSLAAQEQRVLTTAAEIRALTPEEAAQQLPIRLTGCFMSRELFSFAIIDETDGIFLFTDPPIPTPFEPGDLVEVIGVTNPGDYAPCATAKSIRRIGKTDIPAPVPATIAQLHSGQWDAEWVEITGIVRSIEFLPDPIPRNPYDGFDPSKPPEPHLYTLMKLADGNAEISVELQEILDPNLYLDAEIRLRGLNFYLHNDNRQAVRPILHSTDGILPEIVQPPLTKDFNGKPRPVSSLFTFDHTGGNPGHRVHVRGIVTHHRPGQVLWIRDETHSLEIHSNQSDTLQPGDIVDVLGFPEPGTYSPILQDAVFRKSEQSPAPAPIAIEDITMISRHDSDLVQIRATLVEYQRYPESIEFTLSGLGTTISASLLIGPEGTALPNWEPGSIVAVSGIAAVGEGETIPRNGLWAAESLHLLLRSPADLAVLTPAPWWNAKRTVYALSAVLLVSVIAIAFVVLQSRKKLREQQQQRAMAESEFSAILNERNRVAREIHDTLAQNIGAISVQLEMVRTDSHNLGETTQKHIQTAHKLARTALADARDSIWNMRSQVLEKYDLSGALERIAKQLTDDTDIEIAVDVVGKRRRLPPVVENNLLRIGQEALTNACKHANPKTINVRISYQNRRLELLVSDDGIGFDIESLSPESKKSFGLVGIRERVELLAGEVEIQSAPGKGTSIRVNVSD